VVISQLSCETTRLVYKANYSRQLTQVMHNMFLVSEVATLAKSLTTTKGSRYQVTNSNAEAVFGWRDRCVSEDEPSETENGEQRNDTGAPTANGPYLFDSSRRSLIKQALEDWEEPGREASLPVRITIRSLNFSTVLQAQLFFFCKGNYFSQCYFAVPASPCFYEQ
jgi:hypothetical protein